MVLLLLSMGCRGERAPDDISSQDVIGWVHKGPFETGGTVRLLSYPEGVELDSTTIRDDLGAFSLRTDALGLASLSATGTWYNELTGSVETTPLTLRSHIEVIASQPPANINLVTELSYDRIGALLLAGRRSDHSVIVAQAEAELYAAIGIGGASFVPAAAAELSLLGDDASSVWLAILGALVLRAAADFEGGMETFLTTLREDFADDAELEAPVRSALDEAKSDVDFDAVLGNLEDRIHETDPDAAAPEPDAEVFDADGAPDVTIELFETYTVYFQDEEFFLQAAAVDDDSQPGFELEWSWDLDGVAWVHRSWWLITARGSTCSPRRRMIPMIDSAAATVWR